MSAVDPKSRWWSLPRTEPDPRASRVNRGRSLAALLVASATLLATAACSGGPSTAVSPSPSDQPRSPHVKVVGAVRFLTDALQRYPIVALGESHNLKEAGEFYAALVQNPAFAAAADAVVVEFGNSRYQSLVDRYVAGGRVSPRRLRRVWQDTTQVGAWDAPMYGRFFAAVRAGNASRPESEQLRVILGDPPINWLKVHSSKQVRDYLLRREPFVAHVAEQQVLDTGDHALLIAGLAHLERTNDQTGEPNVTEILEKNQAGSVFVVGTHLGFPSPTWEERLLGWPIPSIVELRDTWIGRLPRGTQLAQDVFDAMLYLGPPDSLHLSFPLPSTYVRGNYWATLKRRWALSDMGPFSARALFSAFVDPGYPGMFSTLELQNQERFATCMRGHDVEDFPEPQLQYDAAGFYGRPIQVARQDPGYAAAAKECLPLLAE